MIDIVLLIGRLLFVALLYLFLFAIMKTGIGLVKGQRKKEKAWSVAVEKGPKELRGAAIDVHGPIVVGRSPGADIVIGAEYVSSRHARFVLMGQNLFIEDMGSQPVKTYLSEAAQTLATCAITTKTVSSSFRHFLP